MATSDANVLYFEDLEEGTVQWGVECVVNQTEMIEYALKNDPLPMHIDEQAARTSLYGSLIASSGFTISLWFRSSIPIARRLVVLGALEWRFTLPRPVYAGNRLRNKWTVVSKRLSSRPGRGVLTTKQELLNERDEPVLVCDGVILVATKPG
jgi:acyl dehydratase